jgi:hypothetical protein
VKEKNRWGSGDVPYRGQPEPEGEHRSHRHRSLTEAEKRRDANTKTALFIFTLIPLVAGYFFYRTQNSWIVYGCAASLIFMLTVDAMILSGMRRKR